MPENDVFVGPSDEKVRISPARLKRYPSLAETFRPMSEKETTAVVENTTEQKKEN